MKTLLWVKLSQRLLKIALKNTTANVASMQTGAFEGVEIPKLIFGQE